MPSRERVEQLIQMVERGKYDVALETFYAENATMQENNAPPRAGLANLVAHERQVMATFKEIRAKQVNDFLIHGDRVVICWDFDFVHPAGKTFHLNELAYQLWQSDKIVQERFYYDPAQLPR
jgi:ketosteroid isomerase-like protein